MSAITAAIYERLAGDATLAAMLATYQGTPAVFTDPDVPEGAGTPYVHAAGNVAAVPFDTKTTRGRDITRDIVCVVDAAAGMARCEAIAERVRALFHRQRVAVAGHETIIAEASGPVLVPTDGTRYALAVTVRLVVMEV